MSVEIKRVMEKDEKGVDRQVYPITHIDAVVGIEELSSEAYDEVVIVASFMNKITGSMAENPNIARLSTASTLLPPNHVYTREAYQSEYNSMKEIDDKLMALSSPTNLGIPQGHVYWNVLELVERGYPKLKGISVDKLVPMIREISLNMRGSGIGPLGNKLYYKIYENESSWTGSESSSSADVALINYKLNSPDMIRRCISAKGMINTLVHPYPSDGKVTSYIWIEYTNIEIKMRIPIQQKIPTMKQFNEVLERLKKLESK